LKGANVNAGDHRNITPLEFALAKEYKDMAELLVKHGAKVPIK
jgi:ankyrin repeat protein